ncbi:cell cycle checkpoint control protein RAD9A isoform X2 [Eurosta solidaginis]|uniref:cell cycle checkpoint control protein RAD9A isoform X2 n=1 Tax=Eurosta solidaginis TaxID=178769 RepID=UPI0035307346
MWPYLYGNLFRPLLTKMKCTLDGGNTRVFAKAVQSLSKFGGDMFVEADNDGMLLRTLNSTKSAVGTYRFNKSFFECYEVGHQVESYCKLDMKACLNVFRSTKQVERCDMVFIHDKAKFQIQLKCQHETLKNTCISVDDEENITADMTPENTCNCIQGSHKIFAEISNNFNPAEEEITLEAHDKKVNIKNYVEGSRVNDKFMRSQLQLNADEFENYKVEKETSITFCLKEFRALLMFAEALNESLCLQFDEAGSPVFVSIRHRDDIYCLLIMSTLSPEEVSYYASCKDSEVRECTLLKTAHKRKLIPSEAHQSKGLRHDSKQRRIAEQTTLSNTSSLFKFGSSNNKRSSLPSSADIPRNEDQIGMASSEQSMHLLPSVPTEPDKMHDVIQQQQNFAFSTSNSEDEDCILESPKRHERTDLRTIFSRCFHSTFVPSEPSKESSGIYAPSSDTED